MENRKAVGTKKRMSDRKNSCDKPVCFADRKEESRKGRGLRQGVCAVLGGLFMGISCEWGRQLDTAGNVNFTAASTWLGAFGISLLAAFFLHLLGRVMERFCSRMAAEKAREKERRKKTDRFFTWLEKLPAAKRLILSALALFWCWLPVFLAVYPGFFAYDATDELQEVLTGQYVTRHPLIHVLVLGKTVSFVQRLTGNVNFGIAAYVIVQMAVMAALLSWVLESMGRLGAGRVLKTLGFLWFALFPVVPMYVLCTSKDIWYTACMLAVLILVCLMEKNRKAFGGDMRSWIGLGIALWGMAMFRNNGFYVFLVMIPVLLYLSGRACRKRMAAVILLVLAVYFGVNGCLKAVLKPVSTDAQETLTVPIQQLARAWHYSPELFEKEDRQALFEILPEEVLEGYNPKLSDLVKIDFQTENYEKDPQKYQKLWLKIGMKAPFTYVNAWLMTSYGFWYPFTVIDVYNGTRYYTESSYFSCETEPPGWRHSFFPALERVYQEISWGARVHRIPVLSWLFSPGFLCWIYVLTGLFLLSRGKLRAVYALAPVFLNWLTVLLGPTFLVRYVLIFWFALPLLPVVIKMQMCYTSMDNAKSGRLCPERPA